MSKANDVGPLDVSSWLDDLRAGKLPPLTGEVQVCLHPEVAGRADEIADRINELLTAPPVRDELSITEAPADPSGKIEALEAEHDALLEQYQGSLVTLKFRAQHAGDAAALPTSGTVEDRVIAMTALFSVDPVLSVDDVKALTAVIGMGQFGRVTDCWANLGAPSGPKSLTRSPSPATGKR